MCSIFGILDIKSDAAKLRPVALEMSKKLRHRGPDWSGIYSSEKAILAHERLAIVGLNSGAQPLYSQIRSLSLPLMVKSITTKNCVLAMRASMNSKRIQTVRLS